MSNTIQPTDQDSRSDEWFVEQIERRLLARDKRHQTPPRICKLSKAARLAGQQRFAAARLRARQWGAAQ